MALSLQRNVALLKKDPSSVAGKLYFMGLLYASNVMLCAKAHCTMLDF